MIIETFQEYFSISSFGRKHEASFYNFLVLHKLYTVCVTHGHDKNYMGPCTVRPIQFFNFLEKWNKQILLN